nr:uncharacterized protein LOC128705522 [Cherax quadricarinatus]
MEMPSTFMMTLPSVPWTLFVLGSSGNQRKRVEGVRLYTSHVTSLFDLPNRFENTATLCEWPVDTWATRLGMLFSSTALNIYATLSQDICNYCLLKKAILKAYQKTTNSYRKDFRYATLQHGQNFQQLQVTLFRLFDFWIESSGIDHSFESLRDFMVADQFLTALPHQIRTFIRERKLIKAEEVAEAADLYAEAHNS